MLKARVALEAVQECENLARLGKKFGVHLCQPDGRPLTAGMTKHPLLRALRMAGVSPSEGCVGWHDLHHTYGSNLARRGMALKVIQELMGHVTIEMTMRYAYLSPEVWESEVKELDRLIAQPLVALAGC